MGSAVIAFWLTVVGTACWAVCFLWMHRISVRQQGFLEELREQGRRIEELSRVEHDLIKQVHPQVNEIRDSLEAVAEDMSAARQGATSP
jgi:hypothetical protein